MNLQVFDFDYDLVWAGFFVNAEEKIYGRFGGRGAESAEEYLSLAGLRYAMQQALAAHQRQPAARPVAAAARSVTVEQYPAAKRVKGNACIHCHQVYDFRREEAQAAGKWRREDPWVYPLPENVGLRLDKDQGDRLKSVLPNSPADHAGLRCGDILKTINNVRVASFADVQFALHRAPARGEIAISWENNGKHVAGVLKLAEGWRQTDLSWRASTRRLGPPPCVHGEDLSIEEKKALGLPAKALAFRQGNFVSTAARQAGIRQNDIILGIDGKALEMTVGQFCVYIRLNYQVGDRVTFNILRDGQRLDLPLKLPSRAPY